MNEYTIRSVKKETEKETLSHFLDAYNDVTGEMLEVLQVTERPDFICSRDTESKIGVELTKVRRGHPNDILWDNLLKKQNFMSSEHAIQMIQYVAAEKERKRNDAD